MFLVQEYQEIEESHLHHHCQVTDLSANLPVLEVQMSCQMQYQNHVQSLNVMFVKRHENIGIFKSIFSNRAIRKSQPAKIQNTT